MPQVNNFGLAPGQIPLRSRTVTLTAADILALGTPFELVPAPGAGVIVVVFGVAGSYHFGTNPYQPAVAPSLRVIYAGDATELVHANPITTFLLNAQSQFGFAGGGMMLPVNILPGDENKAIQLFGVDFHGGPIVSATLGAGGAGYAANDTGTITTNNGDAEYKVLTVGGGGAVLTFSITAPGTAYAVGNGQATATGGAQPGVGAGFTVNITAVTNGDGTLKVTTYYQIVPVP
jgi:hypothetical protein